MLLLNGITVVLKSSGNTLNCAAVIAAPNIKCIVKLEKVIERISSEPCFRGKSMFASVRCNILRITTGVQCRAEPGFNCN